MPRLLHVACLLCSLTAPFALSCLGMSASSLTAGALPRFDVTTPRAALSWPGWLRVPEAPSQEEADSDRDGISDELEEQVARHYFPFYSLAAHDKCPNHGMLYRVSPHPHADLLIVRYVALYEYDCGMRGHPGDSEVFSTLVDPARPPPEGILAVRTIAHQGTLCESVMTCGSVPGCRPCETGMRDGKPFPIVYASVNKHGGYLSEQVCNFSFVCDYGGCTRQARGDDPPMQNAGEPDAPMLSNLTGQAFVRPDLGWSEASLMDFDPWSKSKFGGAGNVAKDLRDPLYVIDPLQCEP